LNSAFSTLSSRGTKKVVRWLTHKLHCGNGVGGRGGPFLAMQDCFRNEDRGIHGNGIHNATYDSRMGRQCRIAFATRIAALTGTDYTTQLMIQEWGGFPRNTLRMNEEELNLLNGAAER
jgi:hypothetical protein